MDYLQYLYGGLKWKEEFIVLNLVINGLPSILGKSKNLIFSNMF